MLQFKLELKLRRIFVAHRAEMQALGDFVAKKGNRVVFVPGNHDAAILFPQAWQLIKASMRCGDCTNVELASKGYWTSSGSRVFVEHGHQADTANAFVNWPEPFANDAAGVRRLRSPFGERLVREFFDRWETKYPVIDNISGSTGVLQAMKIEGVAGTVGAAAEFMKLLALKTTYRQAGDFLANDKVPPTWRTDTARGDQVGLLMQSLPQDEPEAALAREVLSGNADAFNAELATNPTSDAMVNVLCQSRYIVAAEQEANGVPPAARQSRCEQQSGDLGYLAGQAINKLHGYDVDLYSRISQVLRMDATRQLQGRLVYVYGHTHSAAPPTTPLAPALKNVTIVNTGAWQRLVSADTAKARYPNNDAVVRMKMTDLPPCYSFVWIRFHPTDALAPELLYWSYDKEKEAWAFAQECPDRERLAQ